MRNIRSKDKTVKNPSAVNKGPVIWLVVVIAMLFSLIGVTAKPIKNHLNLGLDLKGGFEILYQAEPLTDGGTVDMNTVVNSLSKRVNVLGVSEPSITVEGNDRVRVQLAGVTDQESAREMLGSTANLTLRDVNDNELADSSIFQQGGASLGYQDGKPVVSLKIADQAKFSEITSNIAAKSSDGTNIMVIWLDYEDGDSYQEEAAKAAKGEEPKYISAATVSEAISGDCIISGNFTETEAKTLANLINSGSLPVKLTEISSNVVSAQYGTDALHVTAIAGAVGIALVMLFMIITYRLPGILSSIMLALYIWAIFGVYALMGATFTLSGIGALVLGVGMTVDVNIINYERIRQELYKGHSIRNSIARGQQLSFGAIFDSQFTTLIAAIIMYIWGNGAVKGFATMLITTVVMTFVINVGFSKWLLDRISNSRIADKHPEWFHVKKSQIPDVSKGKKQFYTGVKSFDYVKSGKLVIKIAVILLAVGLCFGIGHKANGDGFFNKGIDFSSGTKLTITSDDPITVSDVSKEMESLGYDNFSYQAAGDTTVYATTKTAIASDELATLKSELTEKYGQEPGDNVVTPVVGKELVRNAVILTVVAWIAMMLYITIRYEWEYALGCIVTLIHDVCMVLAVFAVFRMEVNTEVISVLLTIIGYSINNSIIVFDRIREHVHDCKEKPDDAALTKIINEAESETIKMSLYGSITTIIPVVVIIGFGARSIFTFMFAMLVGLVAGTFSSIFIAPAVWKYFYEKFGGKKKTKKKKEYKEELDEYTFKGINA